MFLYLSFYDSSLVHGTAIHLLCLMASQTKENYLKSLYFLANEAGEVSPVDLRKSLSVSAPTVTSMVKKLEKVGWVKYEKYRPIQLTPKGTKAAALIIRKHRLTEMFLVEKMGFGWEEVHEIAEQVEHIKSDDFFDRMDQILDFPTVDPHGSPIPNKEGEIVSQAYIKLSEVAPNNQVVLRALGNSSQAFLHFLNKRELELGIQVFVHSREVFDQSMTVTYGNMNETTLSRDVCERLLVELMAAN